MPFDRHPEQRRSEDPVGSEAEGSLRQDGRAFG